MHYKGVLLSKARYKEIEELVVEMYEECGLFTIPIDCFAIAEKLQYIVVPYSYLPPDKQEEAFQRSDEGFSQIELINGMYRFVIYYNDYEPNFRKVRFTIFHEIGHCYLGHLSDPAGKSYDELESEANFFARTAIAPLPLINTIKCQDEWEISDEFNVSLLSSGYIYHAYNMWLQFGPAFYLDHEVKLLQLFGVNAA